MATPVITHDEEVRIVMTGKTGVGKRPAANTILDYRAFKFSIINTNVPTSAPPILRQKVRGVVDGRNISVIDTPGCETNISEDEIKLCYSLAAPGPHVFLIVIRLGRVPVTEEELNSVEKIQTVFGEMSNKYTMVLFTVGDGLQGKPVEDFLKDSPKLQELVRKCDGRYHVFNDKPKDASEVTELLVKIDSMEQTNGRSYYTNDHFQEAWRAIKERERELVEQMSMAEISDARVDP